MVKKTVKKIKVDTSFEMNWQVITLLIISISIYLFSLLSVLSGNPGRWWALVATLVLIASFTRGEENFIGNSIATLRRSFSNIKTNIIFIIICDVLLVLSIAGIIIVGGNFLNGKAEAVDIDLYQIVQDEDQAGAITAVSALQGLLGTMILTFTIMLIAGTIVYSFFKGIVWNLSFRMKPVKKSLIQFFFLNLFWLPVITIIAVLLAISFKPEFAAFLIVIYLAAITHATIILNGVFVNVGQVWRSFGNMWKVGFVRVRYFIIPYLIIIMSFLVVMAISGWFGMVPAEMLAPIMAVIVLPLVMAFGRVYLAQVIKELS